ncbi:peptidoglycan DD-metalloendopeptidase family protein [Bacillus dakarensis]|uniref:peptidoglycan DD-metalloendopeptidase family protein n=1 Tax=Robertmurraya dakarensis TaxID=1926278 RepID=UPI000981E33E|nr:peptidoglycan DD-metalloendopeptidase family protein [Bacillus dakarensis]
MLDFIKRLLIAGIMGVFITLLFLGGKTNAQMLEPDTAAEEWIWPTDGVVTDTFGTRNGSHYGIDIAAGLGTPVYSVDSGIVTKSYYSSSYGHVVFVKHHNNLETVYAHLNKRYVEVGHRVKKGESVGEMGNTGRSSGVHLHFEVHESEWTVNKKNALDPVEVLGDIELGESVQAFKQTAERSDALHASAKINTYDESEQNQYIVQKGDTLSYIAQKTNSTVQTLMKINSLTTDVIRPNQVLVIHSQ